MISDLKDSVIFNEQPNTKSARLAAPRDKESLEKELEALIHKVDEHYSVFGKQVYHKILNRSLNDIFLVSESQKITGLYQQINQVKDELTNLTLSAISGKKTNSCPHCQQPHQPEDNYCFSCGYNLKSNPIASAPLRCNSCGSNLISGAMFCTSCGMQVG